MTFQRLLAKNTKNYRAKKFTYAWEYLWKQQQEKEKKQHRNKFKSRSFVSNARNECVCRFDSLHPPDRFFFVKLFCYYYIVGWKTHKEYNLYELAFIYILWLYVFNFFFFNTIGLERQKTRVGHLFFYFISYIFFLFGRMLKHNNHIYRL